MVKKIVFSSPISIVLAGGPGIIFGKPALACATSSRVTVKIWESKEMKIDKNISLIVNEVEKYLIQQKIIFANKSFDLETTIDEPFTNIYNLPAHTLCLTAALLTFYSSQEFEQSTINSIAYQIEKKKQKGVFGLLSTASCFGGLIYFRKEFEFLKTISQLAIKIPKKIEENLYIVKLKNHSQTTPDKKANAGEIFNKNPKKAQGILEEMEKVVRRFVVALTSENTKFFRQTMRENQILLEQLGVVSKQNLALIGDLKKIGEVTVIGATEDSNDFILGYFANRRALESILKKRDGKFQRFSQDDRGLTHLV